MTADAAWLDDHTAQFRVVGEWGVGPVTVESRSGGLRDRAGNLVLGQTARFGRPDARWRIGPILG